MDAGTKTLVLSDGGLVSLLAAAIARESSPPGRKDLVPIVAPWIHEGPTAELRRRAVHTQAESLRLQFAVKWRPPELVGTGAGDAAAGARDSLALISAVQLAARQQCSKIVWPVQAILSGEGVAPHDPEGGLDVDLIALSFDRAVLASRLGSLELAEPLAIETPFCDLTDRQVADLAAEMELPLHACWWWGSVPGIDLADAERRRWYRAFTAAGFPSLLPPLAEISGGRTL